MNREMEEQLLNQKKVFDILGVKHLTSNDKRVVNYVTRSLTGMQSCKPILKNPVSLEDSIKAGICNLKIFGESYYNQALKFSHAQFIPCFPNSFSYVCNVTFSGDKDTDKIDKCSGTVNHFKIPQSLDVSAPIFLTHEFIHGLKETNYEEFILTATVSDVIPMFYELIGTETNPEVRDSVFNARIFLLIEEIKSYKRSLSMMNGKKIVLPTK